MAQAHRSLPSPTALNARLDLQPLVAAFTLDLPSFKGRLCQHDILTVTCDSHDITCETVQDIAHPMEASGMASVAAPEAASYVLFRAIPKGAPPPKGWPILYMLDGNAAFDFLTTAQLAEVPDLVIIGVGYETEAQFERRSRARDLTFPAQGQVGLEPEPAYGDRLAGGALQFLPLLTGALRETAEAGLQIDPARRTLWGHSLGGLFALRVMLQAPKSFARFAAISPSLWLHPDRLEVGFEAAAQGQNALYLGSGNREKRSFTDGPEPNDAPEAFYDLVARFEHRAGTQMCWQVYDGAVHIASLPSSIAGSLRFAAADL